MFTGLLWAALMAIAILICVRSGRRAFGRVEIGPVSQKWLITQRSQDAAQFESRPRR
jgi:hypothetical protein